MRERLKQQKEHKLLGPSAPSLPISAIVGRPSEEKRNAAEWIAIKVSTFLALHLSYYQSLSQEPNLPQAMAYCVIFATNAWPLA